MNNATKLKSSAIAALAVTLLVKPESEYKSGTSRYCCNASSHAAVKLTGLRYSDAKFTPEATAVRERISEYINGEHVAEDYVKDVLGGDCEDANVMYEFRVKMLTEIAAEFEAKELLQRQIDVLNQVKELRVSNPSRSNYVCDNIQHGYGGRGLNLGHSPVAEAICADIKEYIGGAFSVDEWLDKEAQHAEVEGERIKMIDTLIARYQAELEVA